MLLSRRRPLRGTAGPRQAHRLPWRGLEEVWRVLLRVFGGLTGMSSRSAHRRAIVIANIGSVMNGIASKICALFISIPPCQGILLSHRPVAIEMIVTMTPICAITSRRVQVFLILVFTIVTIRSPPFQRSRARAILSPQVL